MNTSNPLPPEVLQFIEQNSPECTIQNFLIHEGNYIILFRPKESLSDLRNIVAVAPSGELIWTIPLFNYSPYTPTWYFTNLFLKNEKFIAYNGAGFELTFDPTTGEIIDEEFTR